MAAECPFAKEDVTCPLCYEVFNDPVTLNCKHSFCKGCIQTRWECRGLQQCPVCHRTSSSSRPFVNQALRKVSDVFKQKPEHFMVSSVERCSIHNEELKFFCRKDAEPICQVCTSTRSHANHKYCSITEATSEIMVSVKSCLQLQMSPKWFVHNSFSWYNCVCGFYTFHFTERAHG